MEIDAWELYRDLLMEYTQTFEVRARRLTVTANALDRSVTLVDNGSPHNVATMRELAEAITAACDFVEESNPKWAAGQVDFMNAIEGE